MRKLSVNTFATLDGVMQAPGGPGEDPSGGFAYEGWSVNYWDEAMGQWMDAFMSKGGELLLGRKTYEIFAGYWPHQTDNPTADALNSATKHVASKTLTDLKWENSRLLGGDATDAVRDLKGTEGPELQIHGSSDLLQSLLGADLIDEFRVWTFPLVIGSGKKLFGPGTLPRALKVVDSKTSSTGVVFTIYEPAGEIVTGTFADE